MCNRLLEFSHYIKLTRGRNAVAGEFEEVISDQVVKRARIGHKVQLMCAWRMRRRVETRGGSFEVIKHR